MKAFFKVLTWYLMILVCLSACQKVEHDTAELVDPWLKDNTLTSFRLVGQVGPTVISTDWRHEDKGTISLNLIVNAVDLSAVTVAEIGFKISGEFSPKASVKVGETIDLSSGKGQIVVTAKNGASRVYEISYSSTELFSGTFTFVTEKSSLTWGDATYCYFAGGPDGDVRTGNIYDHLGRAWSQDEGRWPNDEMDNTVSFKQTYFDSDLMCQYGSFVNIAGEDGLWADYTYVEDYTDEGTGTTTQIKKDCNSIYRLLPKGKGRWSNEVGSDVFKFYEYSDDTYSNPICEATMLYAGSYPIEYPGANVASWCPKAISVGDVAFTRQYPFEFVDHGAAIATYMADNVRQVWWKMNKVSDQCLENHDSHIAGLSD